MGKGRLEAFSDGVIAIIITIMVLELKVPHGASLSDLRPLVPTFVSYVLSFVFIGIYWNNHHHLLQTARHVKGGTLWANMHLLFWLSVVPLTTEWIGETHFAPMPMAVYGFVLLCAGIAYLILTRVLISHHGKESVLARAVGAERKGMFSAAAYASAIPLAFVSPWISGALYVLVAVLWLVPDRRIEKILLSEPS